MTPLLTHLIGQLAALRRIELRADWADQAGMIRADHESALEHLCEALGWARPVVRVQSPRAHEFPLLAYHPVHGWAIAERLDETGELGVLSIHGEPVRWTRAEDYTLYDVIIPAPGHQQVFPNALSVFRHAVLKRRSPLALAVIATVVVNLIALATSIYSMQVYDRVVPRGAFSTLWVLSFGTIAALGFDFLIRIVRAHLLEHEAARIDSEVSEYFFARANDVRLDARPPSIGTMAAQLKGLEQVRAIMSSAILFAFADLPFALLFIFVVYQLGGVVVSVMLVSFPLALAIALLFARLIREDTRKAQISGNRKNGLLVEALDAAETIKSNRGQWSMLARWNVLLDDVHASELPVRHRQTVAGTLFGTLQQIVYILVIAVGAYEVYEQHMTMGALIACSILSGRINGPLITQLPGFLVQWTYARTSLQMLDAIMDLPSDKQPGVDQLRPNRLNPHLKLRDVAFAYPGARSGLDVPALEIKAGERVAIIGGVGSGKSTLLRLMAGLYAPAQGSVLIDNLDIRQVSEDVVRSNIGYLPQDYRLINGTLRDNLILGLSEPGDDAIMEAAAEVGLSGMIAAHPMGVDLPIAEGGRGLSGGQRVLTGLTRLILARPRLWLLDEPTASLDVDTERRVLQAMAKRIGPDDTLVMVTHKLNLLGLVQRVIVLADGKIAMDGPAREVLARLQANMPARPAGQGAAESSNGNLNTAGVGA